MKAKRQIPQPKAMVLAAIISGLGATLAALDPGPVPGVAHMELELCFTESANCLHVHYGAKPKRAGVMQAPSQTSVAYQATHQLCL